ncbi:MAG: hypothetical protein AMXMBFR13_50100 [Phycisphaerae bacterium]
MSFRKYKQTGTAVVRIGGMPYLLDMERRQLRGELDPEDVIELDDEPCGRDVDEA